VYFNSRAHAGYHKFNEKLVKPMKKLFREPLLHFLILGALIFAAYGWIKRDQRSADEIVVTSGQQKHLVTLFTRTWQRPPTTQEYQSLLRDFIREEIAYRQAVAMGLNEGDTIIRRRMRQKLELLTDEIVSFAEPADADLQQYLLEHPEPFRLEPSMDLRQVYISLDKRGADADAFSLETLELLRGQAGADWQELGDSLPLPAEFTDVRLGELARVFGSQFADGLVNLETGKWTGPVRSGYGLHLVRINNFTPARDPELHEVREKVEVEWLELRRRNATDELYERLAEQYSIEIESLVEETAE
jgi:hypothetical protein